MLESELSALIVVNSYVPILYIVLSCWNKYGGRSCMSSFIRRFIKKTSVFYQEFELADRYYTYKILKIFIQFHI